MFRNFRKVLGSLACAAVLASANSNVKVEASVGARIVAGTTGTVLTAKSIIDVLQYYGVAKDYKSKGDDHGVLGRDGLIGRFTYPFWHKDTPGASGRCLVIPITEGVCCVGSLIFTIIG